LGAGAAQTGIYSQCHRYVTLQRLLRMRAGFVQQIDGATALIAELRDDSPGMEPACQWLVDSRKAVERIDALLGGLDEE
jgi:hypothetical protein